jgi:hypothetical protein
MWLAFSDFTAIDVRRSGADGRWDLERNGSRRRRWMWSSVRCRPNHHPLLFWAPVRREHRQSSLVTSFLAGLNIVSRSLELLQTHRADSLLIQESRSSHSRTSTKRKRPSIDAWGVTFWGHIVSETSFLTLRMVQRSPALSHRRCRYPQVCVVKISIRGIFAPRSSAKSGAPEPDSEKEVVVKPPQFSSARRQSLHRSRGTWGRE